MAAVGGGFNPNILLNALNNLTNALGAGGNNWANINNAVNALRPFQFTNNNVMQNRGTQAAQVLTFYRGNQDPIAWLNKFNLACAANGWNNAQKLQVIPAYLKGAAAVWYQTVVGNPINMWDGAANNNTFKRVFKQRFRMPALAYPAQRNWPITRSHPYAVPDEEKEKVTPTTNIVDDSVTEMKEIQLEKNTDKGKGTAIPTIATTNTTIARLKKKVVAQKSQLQKSQPSIAAHIQPYNIVTDLQQQRVNISFGQLFQISPKL
ncbi:hypothetical protein C1646_769632 [Rhizophagus diaphanus]|nr:hypothetical protein C1646_769632 [Rhizophagus diaphanus] [Rhizophagus sp. MUCL 43196]